ncbi:MAG: sigma-54 dependent transcriptional regulator [Bacteroidota bacterium]|nr:sigma-54 dependent transcriptional regulator [Bacteroidota bacterium]
MIKTILIIDDEDDIRRYCNLSLKDRYTLIHVRNGTDGLEKLATVEIDAVLLDRSFIKADPDKLIGNKENVKNEGIAILQAIRLRYPNLPVIMITQFGDYAIAKEALAVGATDFIEWGALTSDQFFLHHYIERAIRTSKGDVEVVTQKYNAFGIIGSSNRIVDVFNVIEKYKDSALPVLIQGASGTGKELVARALHFLSFRKQKPFIPVDCGALTDHLAESELFGHVKGSYTDAHTDKKGLFEVANEGSLFLDEIGNLSPNIQTKLLRIVETGEMRRIGETAYRRINVRIIAATNSDLDPKTFRSDLYWRLNGTKISIPELKKHKEDIPELVHYFIIKYGSEYDKLAQGIAAEALDYLKKEDFHQNNIRELELLIKRCVTNSNEIITLSDIVRCREERTYNSKSLLNQSECPWTKSNQCPLMDNGTMEEIEKTAITHRLEIFNGKKEEAAKSLGIGKSKFYQKLKEYNVLKKT